MLPDHYATLGLSRAASPREVKAARQRLLRLHHPDVSKDDAETAKAKTIEILVASQVLLDGVARRAYDASLGRSRGVTPPPGGVDCPKCGRYNVSSNRHYCIYCGAGVGQTPRPVTWSVGAYRSDSAYTIGVHLGCGAVAGALLGMYIAWRVAWRTYLHAPGVLLIVGLSAAIVAALTVVFRDRLGRYP